MSPPEVSPGWGSMSGHHRWCVPCRHLPELTLTLAQIETKRQNTTACVLLEETVGQAPDVPPAFQWLQRAHAAAWQQMAVPSPCRGICLYPLLGLPLQAFSFILH